MVAKEICVNRECVLQPMGPHYTENEWILFNSAMDDPRLNRNLEELKNARGRRCVDCKQPLLPTDKDHSFCEDCWDRNMQHEFMGLADTCSDCGEEEDHRIHAKQETS